MTYIIEYYDFLGTLEKLVVQMLRLYCYDREMVMVHFLCGSLRVLLVISAFLLGW